VTVDLKSLRSRLEEEKKNLSEELEALRDSLRPAEERREGSPFGKREEEATETMELEKRLTLEKSLIDRLATIDHALHKFDDGSYGKCDVCGEPIDPARLEALPQASLCLKCKEEQAKNAKIKASPG
jgi:RNA polymerase-binding protein DksA